MNELLFTHSLNEFLAVNHGMTLQHFEIVLFIGRVLVDDEQVLAQARDDEAEVELWGNEETY